MSTQTLEDFAIGDTVRHARHRQHATHLKDTGEVCGFTLTRVRVKVGEVTGLYWPDNLVKVLPAPAPAMPATNYHKLEQRVFFYFNGLKSQVDGFRETLREFYPVGAEIETQLLEESRARRFIVTECSHDGYDVDKVAAIRVVDLKGNPYVFVYGDGSELRVVTRPAPPPPPLVLETAPAPWEPGEGWYLLAKDEPLKPGDGYVHPDHHAAGFIDYACRPDWFREERGGKETAHKWQWRRRRTEKPCGFNSSLT